MDPAVRSIRIATTLNERFGRLIREAEADQTVAEFELKIGEAQQIYPEIWRHLDEARTTLLARGALVADYDRLRATEQPGQLAVENIEGAEAVNPLAFAIGGPLHVQYKTATFNAEGHHKAVAACEALMQALPEVDWAALERAEEAQIAAAGSLNASKWKQAVLVAAIAAAVLVALKLLA